MTNSYASVCAAKWLVSGYRTAVQGTICISLAVACFLFNSGAAPSLIIGRRRVVFSARLR